MAATMLKPLPTFASDEEAERFVDTADLSEYDLSGFVPLNLDFEEPAARLLVSLPDDLLDAARMKARQQGVSYERFIREAIERAVAG